MTTITTYQTDDAGIYLYQGIAQQFALDPDRHNVAFRAVLKAPPAIPEGKRARWISESAATDPGFLEGSWVVEDIPVPNPIPDGEDDSGGVDGPQAPAADN